MSGLQADAAACLVGVPVAEKLPQCVATKTGGGMKLTGNLPGFIFVVQQPYLQDRVFWRWGIDGQAAEIFRGSVSPRSRTLLSRLTIGEGGRIPCASSSAIAVSNGRCRPQKASTSGKVGTLRRPRRWRGTPIWWRDTLFLLG